MAALNEKTSIDSKSPDEIQGSRKDTGVRQSYEAAVLKSSIKLHPQPTADPLDPLNWSSFKKHTILGVVMFK